MTEITINAKIHDEERQAAERVKRAIAALLVELMTCREHYPDVLLDTLIRECGLGDAFKTNNATKGE